MMGAGKSSVGRQLAARLGRPFVDTDLEVERGAGASVAEIFAREGEAGFRARERAAVAAIAGSRAVVSLGGGAIAQPGAADALAASGTIVYLRARPETLVRRVGVGEERPLLRGLDMAARLAKLRDLLAARAEHYERAAVVIDTDEDDADAVAVAIVRRLPGEGA
jgi:shikimate kinase